MARCAFIKPGGDRCGSIAMKGYDTCYGHRPDLADERQRNASKGGKRGGRGRPQRETEAIKTQLEDLTEQVLSGDLETARAAVANQLINTRLRAIEVERKIREAEEMEERLTALEERLSQNRGGRKWGA
jgi:hypothetical protein